jgi:uncharacterized protein (DUF2062 family)
MPLRIQTIWKKLKAATLHELHANASPLRASLSLALGILIGFCPLYGLHTPIVIALAFLFRLNRVLAILAASTTILPFVPFWLAAGIFTGKQVIPLEAAGALVNRLRSFLPDDLFDHCIHGLIHITKHFMTPAMIHRVAHGGSHQKYLSEFMQWVIGCSVFAVISSIVTFTIAFFLLTFLHNRRLKRLAAHYTKMDGQPAASPAPSPDRS